MNSASRSAAVRADGNGSAPVAEVSLDYLPFAAALLDESGAIAVANAQWQAAHPATAEGQSLLHWSRVVHQGSPGLRDALVAGVDSVLAGRQPRFNQDHVHRSRQHRITVTPGGDGALVLHEDSGLLNPVDERTFELQKMEMVGRLAAGVTHDFANLLTLIAGYSDLMLKRLAADDPLRVELEEIRKAANRGARLTGQLMGFTRGRASEPKPLDLNLLVTDMERMLRPIMGEYLELRTRLAADLGRVIADPGQMEQVLMNLILNARDAMPHGGSIHIETSNQVFDAEAARGHGLAPGSYVLLAITDTGHGIESASLSRVFEPFYTTKERGKGTGLGLSTVRGIARQSGGDVWVRSTEGEGASFTLCLPLVAEAAEGSDADTPPRPEPTGSETILLVEDEEPVRQLLNHVLSRRGYTVLQAADGEEAWRIFQAHSGEIHLVLTDMVLPRMSGRALAERMLAVCPETRIVYMSGYTDDILVRTGALGPGMSFLQKPLRPEVLAAAVRAALDTPSAPFNPR